MSKWLAELALGLRVRPARPWVVFAAHQVALFASAWIALHAVRACTGRTVHGGQDPIGLGDGVAIVGLYGAHLALTRWMHRRWGGPGELGLAVSRAALVSFVVGTIASSIAFSAPWVIQLASGRLHVVDDLAPHLHEVSLVSLAFGWIILFLNSIVEEATSRAMPMRLFGAYSLAFRLLVPSLVFAALHLADEPFDLGRFASRTLAGVTLSLAYAATGNVWLAAGIHTGMNYAAVVPSGLWHFGGLVALSEGDGVPGWVVNLAVAVLAAMIFARRRRLERRCGARGIATASPR